MTTPDLESLICSACGQSVADHRRANGRQVACRGSVAPDDEALTLTELGARLKLAPRTIYGHRKRHDHPAIQELPKLGPGHPRFSRRAVEAWLAGQTNAPEPRRRPLLSAHKRVVATSQLRLARAR